MTKNNNLFDLCFNNPTKLLQILNKGLVIDTKILILYLIGVIDMRKNTKYLGNFNYKISDFKAFINFKEKLKIRNFIVTPNILTEFFNQIENNLGSKFFPKYKEELKPFIEDFEEKYYQKEKIVKLPKFGEFDFTDLSIYLSASLDKHNIITPDKSLYYLCKGESNSLIIGLEDIRNLDLNLGLFGRE